MGIFQKARALANDITSTAELKQKASEAAEWLQRHDGAYSDGGVANRKQMERIAEIQLVLLAHKITGSEAFNSAAVKEQLGRFEALVFVGWQGHETHADWLVRAYASEEERKLAQAVTRYVMQGTANAKEFAMGKGRASDGKNMYLSSEKYELFNAVAMQEIGQPV